MPNNYDISNGNYSLSLQREGGRGVSLLLFSYHALFDTHIIAPNEVIRRLCEVLGEAGYQKDELYDELLSEGKICRMEYNFKYGDYTYVVEPSCMAKHIKWLFETKEGHAILDMLKPLFANYNMEQTLVQTIVTDYVRSRYLQPGNSRGIYKTDIPYFIPVCDDSDFTAFFLKLSEGSFVTLVKDTIDNAYRCGKLLNTTVMYVLVESYNYTDITFHDNLISALDLYTYLAYGIVDVKKKKHAKAPDTHLLSAVYETYNGNYLAAVPHFAEAQRLYNAKTSIIEMRGIFPQPLINAIHMLMLGRMKTDEAQRHMELMLKRKDTEYITLARALCRVMLKQDTGNVADILRDVNTEWFFMKQNWEQLFPHQAPWEIALDALMTKLNNNRPVTMDAIERQERVAYFITDIFQRLAVPRLQSITKGGTWSVGKVLAYHQFMAMSDAQLMPGDIIIRQRNQNLGYINNYQLTLTSILPEMTNASRLFVGKSSPYTLVTVTEDVPYIMIERVEGGFEVKTNVPPECIDENTIITSRTESSISFLQMTEDIRPFFAHLINIGFFPNEAEDKLKVFLKHLGKKVEIHSPLVEGGTTLETIQGVSKATLQVIPKGREGYECQIFCRPLEEGRVKCKAGEGLDVIIDAKDGQRYCVKRNLVREKEIADTLLKVIMGDEDCEEYHDNIVMDDNTYMLDAYALLPVIDYIREHKDEVNVEWPEGKQLRVKQRMGMSQWKATLKKNQHGWFELEGTLQVDENTFISMQQLLGLLDGNRSRYIKMGDGEFLALSEKLRSQLEAVDALTTRSRGHLQMSPFTAALLDGSIIDGELQIEVDDELKEIQQKILDLSDYKAPVPATLNATLRDYQKEGYQWIARFNEWGAGTLLADDMGLGKTIQTISYLLHKCEEGPQLVVAPASVAPNWLVEFGKFAPSLNVELLNFSANRSVSIANAGKRAVIVTTYALLLSVKEEITQKDWVTVCLDEAHVIKNRGAKTSGVCMKLKAKNRVMLTGTPVQNHLGELWNLFQFVNPGLLGSYEDFGRRFITPIEVAKNKERQKQLERLVRPFMLRRTKDSVLSELPEKTEIYQTVSMTQEEMAVYEVIRQEAERMLEAEEDQDHVSLNTLAEITRLRQAACSAKLVDKQWRNKSSKVEALVEALEPVVESGDSALVFSQFTSFLAIVKQRLDDAHIPYLYIDGAVAVKERQRMVEEFQRGEGPSVFLISLKAGGLGLNLTRANYVFHLDPWWNPAIEQQATDRAHRIGQHQAVTVYHLLSENTIEEKIRRLHEQKRDLAASVLDGTDMSGRLTGKEMMELVSPLPTSPRGGE